MYNTDKFLLAGVMGWPVSHSRSPIMHNHWIMENKLTGLYLPIAVKPSGLSSALSMLKPLGFAGCNITIPHKQTALEIVDASDEIARTIGAISCITVQKDGSLLGTNNDWYGFIENLKQETPKWRADAGPVLVIGSGGASRAICYGLIREGAKEIRIVNRTYSKACDLAKVFGKTVKPIPWNKRNEALKDVALVANTTSQGMTGTSPLDICLKRLPLSAIVTDTIYTPLNTPFLKSAKLRGNHIVNGLGMLFHQGVPAWKQWFNIEPVVSEKLRKKTLKK